MPSRRSVIGASDVTPRKAKVRDMLLGIKKRHPRVALAGLAFLWPDSKSVARAFDKAWPEIVKAYQDLVAIHDDPEVAQIFGRKTWSRVPPLPWEETKDDVVDTIEEVFLFLPQWATPEEMVALQDERVASLQARLDALDEAEGVQSRM